MKEFRKKKGQMQQELDEIKEAMVWNERSHKESLERFEQKFLEEKNAFTTRIERKDSRNRHEKLKTKR